MSLSDTAF